MGYINTVNPNPRSWPVADKGLALKQRYGGEPVIDVEYGACDADMQGQVPRAMYMRKSVYEKCLSGEYRVDKSSQDELRLVDRNGRRVEPVLPEEAY